MLVVTGFFAGREWEIRRPKKPQLMFGVGVNSNAGVTGAIMIDDRQFDGRKSGPPRASVKN